MWRIIILLASVGILGLVIRSAVTLLRGYRPPRKSLPPKSRDSDIEDADYREVNSSDAQARTNHRSAG